jgi:hypothetical protein
MIQAKETLRRITKAEARRRFAAGQPFLLCPCKLTPGLPFDVSYRVGPYLAGEWRQRAAWYAPRPGEPTSPLWTGDIDSTAWALMYDNWASSNTSWEAGYYAHYYIEV